LRQTGRIAKDVTQTVANVAAGNIPKALEKLPDAFESVVTFLGDQWEERQPWKLRPLRTDLKSYILTSDWDFQRGTSRIFKCSPDDMETQLRQLSVLSDVISRRVA
jgi:hypothetical protein